MPFHSFKRFTGEQHPRSRSPACHITAATVPDTSCSTGVAPEGTMSLDEMFRVHGPNLLGYLRRHAGDDAAADLMQDVFVRAAGSRQRNSLVNPGGFLRRVAKNLLIDRARKRKRDNVVLLPLQEEWDAMSAPEQEHGLHVTDALKEYEQAIRTMPEKTRRVFLMRRVDGLSYREIHEQLGISISTVEYHMVRALGHLSDAMEIYR
ncbi:RNA polymerase sigma factor [Sphingopyxis chilensis]